MGAHGVLRYQKALADLGVRKAFREQFKGLQLPARQRLDEHRVTGRLQGPRTSLQIQRPEQTLEIVFGYRSVSEWPIWPTGHTVLVHQSNHRRTLVGKALHEAFSRPKAQGFADGVH